MGNVGPRSAQSSCLQRPCGDDGVRKAKLKRCLLKGSQAELPKVFAAVVGFSSVARAKRRARQPAQNVDLELGMIDGGEAQHSERVGRWGREGVDRNGRFGGRAMQGAALRVRASSRAGACTKRMEDGGTAVGRRNGRRIISALPGA